MLDLSVGVSKSDALNRQFAKLKAKASKKRLVKALKAGGKVFQHAIQERTPVRTDTISGTALPPGALRDSIEVKAHAGGGKNEAGVTVGPSADTERVMRWLEFGHVQVAGGYLKQKPDGTTRGRGKRITRVPPHPVMRPAWEGSQQESMQAVIDSLSGDEEG